MAFDAFVIHHKTFDSPVQRSLQAHSRQAKGSELHILNNPSPQTISCFA